MVLGVVAGFFSIAGKEVRPRRRPCPQLVTRASIHSIVSRPHEQEIPELGLALDPQSYIPQDKEVFFRFEKLVESFLVGDAARAVLEMSEGIVRWSDSRTVGHRLARAEANIAKKNKLDLKVKVTVDLQIADPEVQYHSPCQTLPP